MLIPLQELMDEDMARCEEVISSFRCSLDADIEMFLRKRAMQYSRLSKAKTFLLVDGDALQDGRINVLAYFAVTLSIIHVPAGFSGNQIKKLDGISANYRGQRLTEFPCYLIGQLAKNDGAGDLITGDEIIAEALSAVAFANTYAGGRFVIVDVKPVDKLVEFYHRNGFELFDEGKDLESDEPMIQMMRAIY